MFKLEFETDNAAFSHGFPMWRDSAVEATKMATDALAQWQDENS